MPVDFFNLPDVAEVKVSPPRLSVWALLFVIVNACGVALAVAFWPKGMPTRGWEFWAWMFAMPSLAYCIALAWRLHFFYDMPLIQAQSLNDERQKVVEHNVAFARRPLTLLASAYITSIGDRGIAGRIAVGEQSLKAHAVRDTQEVVRHTSLPRSPFDGTEDVLELAFTGLLKGLDEQIKSVPTNARIAVWLFIADKHAARDAQVAWARASSRFEERFLPATQEHVGEGLMALDHWLDTVSDRRTANHTLIIAVQLRDHVPDSTGEAAVALLATDQPLASGESSSTGTLIHRPVAGAACAEWTPLSTAIRWGDCLMEDIRGIWLSGVGKTGRDEIAVEFSPQRPKSPEGPSAVGAAILSDVDAALGHTGVASGWLGVALAAEHVSHTAQPQCVASDVDQKPCFLIVRSPFVPTVPAQLV